jgi:hypothetical protein
MGQTHRGESEEGAGATRGRLLYVLWNAWGERNRWFVISRMLTFIEVATIAKEDIWQRNELSQSMRRLSQLIQIFAFMILLCDDFGMFHSEPCLLCIVCGFPFST